MSSVVSEKVMRLDTYKDLRVVWESCQCFIQGLVHFFWSSFEESPTSYVQNLKSIPVLLHTVLDERRTTNKECIASKDCLLVTILEQVADAVLSMTRSMQGCDFDLTNIEFRRMCWRLSDLVAIFASNHWHFVFI